MASYENDSASFCLVHFLARKGSGQVGGLGCGNF